MPFQYVRDEGFLFRFPEPRSAETIALMESWNATTETWIPIEDPETRSHAVFYGMPMDEASLDKVMVNA